MKTTPKESCYTGQTRGPEASHHNYAVVLYSQENFGAVMSCTRCGDTFLVPTPTVNSNTTT